MIFTIGQKRTQRINYIIHLIIVITSLNLQLNYNSHLFNQNGTYITQVHKKETKTPRQWSSSIPKGCKKNSVTTHLFRGTGFNKEVKIIRSKFIKVY